jgi:hypothetical protein
VFYWWGFLFISYDKTRIDTINQNNTFEMANSEANKAVSISAIASVLSEDNENGCKLYFGE